jgi:ABC-2 type transport system permease protein
MLQRIFALIIKEFLAVLKDPKSRFVVIGPPIIQFFIFGYAATYDLKDVRYAVLDQSNTPESWALLSRFESSEAFHLTKRLQREQEIESVINNQVARMVLQIDQNFAQDLHSGTPAALQVIIDGRESNVAMIALGYASTIVQEFGQEFGGAGRNILTAPVIRLDDRAWYNSNLRSRWFIISALGGIISMVVVIVLTSLSVAREREFGTFDQLLVAPFSPHEILIGKAVPGMLFGVADGLLMSLAAVLWFGIPFRGSMFCLVLILATFVLSIVGVGLFISSLSRTMQQGLLGAFIFMMPAVILSGFVTPLANMPQWLQQATIINPMRYVVIALRQVFLEGAGFSIVWPQLVPLLLSAVVMLPLAGWFFRHRTS